MRPPPRVPLLAALVAAALCRAPRPAYADEEASDKPQLTERHEQRVAQRSQSLAKALGRMYAEDPLGSGPKAPKAGKRVVARGRLDKPALDAGAPPVVLGDIAEPPKGFLEKYVYPYLFKDSKPAKVFEWLSHRGGPEEERGIAEAFDYYRLHTSAGKALPDNLRPSTDESDATDGRANFSDTGEALGVTIPLIASGQRTMGQKWSITLTNAELGGPVEARALLLGHELGVHAADVSDGFIANPGAQMPSELRAFAMDVKNYLEIRKELSESNPERLAALRGDPVWQLSDMKARVALGLPLIWNTYTAEESEFKRLSKSKNDHPDPLQAVEAYVEERYEGSGETGAENLRREDDSAVGQYNRATREILSSMNQEPHPFMSDDF